MHLANLDGLDFALGSWLGPCRMSVVIHHPASSVNCCARWGSAWLGLRCLIATIAAENSGGVMGVVPASEPEFWRFPGKWEEADAFCGDVGSPPTVRGGSVPLTAPFPIAAKNRVGSLTGHGRQSRATLLLAYVSEWKGQPPYP